MESKNSHPCAATARIIMRSCRAGEMHWIGGLVSVDSVQAVGSKEPISITVCVNADEAEPGSG